jgi:hypothetical protein
MITGEMHSTNDSLVQHVLVPWTNQTHIRHRKLIAYFSNVQLMLGDCSVPPAASSAARLRSIARTRGATRKSPGPPPSRRRLSVQRLILDLLASLVPTVRADPAAGTRAGAHAASPGRPPLRQQRGHRASQGGLRRAGGTPRAPAPSAAKGIRRGAHAAPEGSSGTRAGCREPVPRRRRVVHRAVTADSASPAPDGFDARLIPRRSRPVPRRLHR